MVVLLLLRAFMVFVHTYIQLICLIVQISYFIFCLFIVHIIFYIISRMIFRIINHIVEQRNEQGNQQSNNKEKNNRM